MTQVITNEARVPDMSLLLKLANQSFAKAVDCDMLGSPITDCTVLVHGAYGPAVGRLVALAVQKQAGKPVNKARLRVLAEEAFAQAEDYNFGGQRMTDYSLVLQEQYGYGTQTLGLVNLAIELSACASPSPAAAG
jgi:hypothetical protein